MWAITPVETSVLLDRALADHQAGRSAEAERLYRQVLSQDPDEPEALNLLGLLLQDRDELTASIAMIEHAIRIDPEFAEAHTNLARAHRASGSAQAAADSARRAIELDPLLAEAHLLLGRALLDLGEAAEAEKACRAAIALDPGLPDAHMNLGVALSRVKDFAGASHALRVALHHRPGDVVTIRSLGIACSELENHDEALIWHRRATELAPNDEHAWSCLAIALGRAQDIAGAIGACRKALTLAPKRADLWTMLGSNTAALGHFLEAADYHRRALEIDPDSTEAQRELVSIGQHKQATDEKAALSAVLLDEARPLRDRIAAGFALGSILDGAKDFDLAFESFKTANRLARSSAQAEGRVVDPAILRAGVDRSIRNLRPSVYDATRGWGDPSELPVFVVGMPRSGTTLVEQIAASHPKIFGAGERKDVLRIVDTLTAGEYDRPPVYWSPENVRNEAAAYVAKLQSMDTGAVRVIDKLPDNIQVLGQIAVLFPNARVILCRRDLRDVCLSCHTQRFADNLTWAHDLAECAARAREIERLVCHWRATLPLRMLEVQYETLVGNLEGQSRRLIDFLGVPWDPACLEFHKTERTVVTASRWQVRQPIYTSSIGRWRNYQRNLGPMLDGLVGLLPSD